MAETLPRFDASEHSPKLPSEGTAIACVVSGKGLADQLVVRGAWRVTAEDRKQLGRGSIRSQIWVVAIHRELRESWIGRPGGDAIVFADEEPPRGPVEGWFHASLAECCKLPDAARGEFDLFAILGPWKAPVVEVNLRK